MNQNSKSSHTKGNVKGSVTKEPVSSPVSRDNNSMHGNMSQGLSKLSVIEITETKPLVDIWLDGRLLQSKKLELAMSLKETRSLLSKCFPDIGRILFVVGKFKLLEDFDSNYNSLEDILVKTNQKYALFLTRDTSNSGNQDQVADSRAKPPEVRTKQREMDTPEGKLRAEVLSNRLDVYDLPKTHQFDTSQNASNTRLNVLMIGAQGVGKTKFMNGLINHMRGVQIQQTHRYFVSKEPLSSTGSPGNTQNIYRTDFA